MDIVADTWEATAAAFNAEVRAALSMFSLEVSAVSADFATGARGLPMSSFSVLFQNELIIQTHKARIRTEAGKVSTVGRVAGAVTVKGVRRAEPALEQGQVVVELGQLPWYRSMTQVW